MRASTLAGAALLACSAALTAAAADFDGSKMLVCANMEAMDCAPGQNCGRGLPSAVGAPVFMRIDFAGNTIVGPSRTSKITMVLKSDDQLLLQGTELGYAWNLALSTSDGRLAATLVDLDGVFVLFGACTPQ